MEGGGAITDDECGYKGGDNYAYLVVDDKSKDAVIIDPANPPEYVFTPPFFIMNSYQQRQSPPRPRRSYREQRD